jgi:hypothetical protein
MSMCDTTFNFQQELNTLYLLMDPSFSFKSKRYPQKEKYGKHSIMLEIEVLGL